MTEDIPEEVLISFNNDADPIWFKWHKSYEDFERWVATPEGFNFIVDHRINAPVNVHIEKEDKYVSIWPSEAGIKLKEIARKIGKRDES